MISYHIVQKRMRKRDKEEQGTKPQLHDFLPQRGKWRRQRTKESRKRIKKEGEDNNTGEK